MIHIKFENVASDCDCASEEIELKNPRLFCISSSGRFKVQIKRNGIVGATMFCDDELFKKDKFKYTHMVQFRPPENSNGNYEVIVRNRSPWAMDIYLSIWDH